MSDRVATAARRLLRITAGVLAASTLTACRWTSAATAEAGAELYRQNGCASCHGRGGHGDGPVGKTLAAPPRDFRDVAAFKQGADLESIASTIANGVALHTGPTSPAAEPHHAQVMPRFDHLSEDERRSLALYVISLRSTAATSRSQP